MRLPDGLLPMTPLTSEEGLKMEISHAVDMCREAVVCLLLVAGPLLLVAVVSGALVGCVQSILRIQDSSVALAVKIFAAGATTVLAFPYLLETLLGFATLAFGEVPAPLVAR